MPAVGLSFDEAVHRYTYDGRPMISVTGALRVAGFVDLGFFTDADRERGARVHASIERMYGNPWRAYDPFAEGADVEPYLRAFGAFLAESAFRIDAVEERVCDPTLMCAGTLDLRGEFVDASAGRSDLVDVIDIKTGQSPPWVGYQTAAYVRLLRVPRGRARRWCLNLRDTGTYRLTPLTKRTDDAVFMAALTVAQAKRGWL